MDEALNLSQQAKLQQRLNPRQVLLGRFLEMTAPELEDEVRRALDENPALEEAGQRSEDNTDDNHADDFNETAEQLQLADYGNEDDIPAYRLEASNRSADDPVREVVAVSQQGSLIEGLMSQLNDVDLTGDDLRIAEYIIGNLDANGYMTRSLPDIADDITISEGIHPSASDMKRVFTAIRRLDPAGIGAVDLRDCLLLQIDRCEKTLTVRIAMEIIADWFDLFSKMHFDQLRSHLGVDADELQKAMDFIRSLNPKPGSLLEELSPDDRLRHIVPDFIVEVDNDGRTTVSLTGNIPELAIEESFRIDDSIPPPAGRRQSNARAFIKRRHDEASTFISMLDMRAKTLMSVMKAIAKIQHEFFTSDDRSTIRPMIIKDIASMTGLNISVISRAAAGKYVMTAHGIYPLKMFFNEKPKDDADASSHEIIDAIEKIISAEDKHKPMSDEAIRTALADRGYDIARRTVTKYRERLGLPVARLRKQY